MPEIYSLNDSTNYSNQAANDVWKTFANSAMDMYKLKTDQKSKSQRDAAEDAMKREQMQATFLGYLANNGQLRPANQATPDTNVPGVNYGSGPARLEGMNAAKYGMDPSMISDFHSALSGLGSFNKPASTIPGTPAEKPQYSFGGQGYMYQQKQPSAADKRLELEESGWVSPKDRQANVLRILMENNKGLRQYADSSQTEKVQQALAAYDSSFGGSQGSGNFTANKAGMVKMKKKDGSTVDVHESRVKEALDYGYSL
jgi:hypothetical protein